MEIEKELAHSYCKLLNSIDWSDEILVKGLREGLSKFLSNAYAACFPKTKKHHKTHYISKEALSRLNDNKYNDLVFEHLVPKSKYIQKPCEELAKTQELSVNFVQNILERYWRIATITKSEDKLLTTRKMPNDWDKADIFARYSEAGITLIDNPYYPLL